MSFHQQFILWALPLVGLPILIHLVNQNRHRTVQWAATMFLLHARKMARGMARLKYILLLIARMLAVAGLIFAVARPIAGGWLGATASTAPDVTIIVLDRSVSMEEQDPRSGLSKRETALARLTQLLTETETATRVVLFESTDSRPIEITNVSELQSLPETSATGTAADMPALMERVTDFLQNDHSGRADIWVCSDLRRTDWKPGAGRWETIRRELAAREGVRLFLLTYPDVAADNFSISVSGVHRRETADGAELVMDLLVRRPEDSSDERPLSLSMTVDGARSQLDVVLTGRQLVRSGYSIPIDRETRKGWGTVQLPHDTNPADNVFHFVYAEPPARKTVVVSENDEAARYFRMAAGTPIDRSLVYETEVLKPESAASVPWADTALLIWQAPLPAGLEAQQLQEFVRSGRTVLFFPPENPGDNQLFGAQWTSWTTPEGTEKFSYRPWRTDTDLLANTQSGDPLPVGQIQCFRACQLKAKDSVTLWETTSGIPLLSRAATDNGAVWFCGTLPTQGASTLLSNGVTFYVMVQRALARGAAALGQARQLTCGRVTENTRDWQPLDDASKDVLLSQRAVLPGLYRSQDQLLALNRPEQEDHAAVLTGDVLDEILAGVEYTQITDSAGNDSSLASEVWRAFLILMILALIAEALLSIPDRPDNAAQPITGTTG